MQTFGLTFKIKIFNISITNCKTFKTNDKEL